MTNTEIPILLNHENMSMPNDDDFEAFLNGLYQQMEEVTTELDFWDWFAICEPPEEEGFAWWKHEKLDQFKEAMSQKGYLDAHSGATYALCLRRIQDSAKNI